MHFTAEWNDGRDTDPLRLSLFEQTAQLLLLCTCGGLGVLPGELWLECVRLRAARLHGPSSAERLCSNGHTLLHIIYLGYTPSQPAFSHHLV